MRIAGGRVTVALGAALLLITGTLATGLAGAQQGPANRADPATRPGLSQKQEDDLAHKHDGYYGALAPQNLHKARPKPPFDMTGTWFVNLRHGFADFMFGPPYPEFLDAGKQAMVKRRQHAKRTSPIATASASASRRMPMIMTRVWPTDIIQLPTSVHMIFGFTNSYRVIFLDGRKHTDPDIAISTYNGESIGHWEGDSLVVSTKYLEPNQHWIDQGLPVSDEFEIVERYRLQDKGKTLEIQYTMTDPKN